MIEMLTAKDVEELLMVDRSTVYRMAENGRLPSIKVGKQWRFPASKIEEWVRTQMGQSISLSVEKPQDKKVVSSPSPGSQSDDLAGLLPKECVQLIQDSYADLLNVMLIITDMDGNPITEPSNPCGLFSAINKDQDAVQRCISSWHDLGQGLNIEPVFNRSHLGLLCARGLIRVGMELKGMVIAGCVAPANWPPNEEEAQKMALDFGVPSTTIQKHLNEIYTIDDYQKGIVLSTVQKVANIVAHIIKERLELMGRLEQIADLALAR